MQFPESWLRAFCNPPLTTVELAQTLTMAGLEVEALRPVAPPCTRVVVGQIKAVAQHPEADRLRVCQVDVGQGGALLNIVCGAPNARVDIKVPCALVGAELPAGDDGQPVRIELGQLRGVPSQGMLCSARELRLSEEHGGGLLELDASAPLGQDIRVHLDLDDMLFTLKLTPNLAHCLSVHGIAREVSALTGAALQQPSFPAVAARIADKLPVQVSATDLCGRFSGRIVRHLNPHATTPQWMRERLARCGQRSVAPLVDISNYVMFELGRPSHIFDLDKICGGLHVRWSKPGEQITLLDGNRITLDDKVGVIADDEQVESLAGIMGGNATAVSEQTRHIYIEAAFWWPKAVAGRSRRLNCATDAGHRFERGVDPSLTVEHIERITALVSAICGTPQTACGPIDDQCLNLPVPQPVTLRVARAAKVIGMPLTQQQCADALQRLALPMVQGDGQLTVTPPAHRFDLTIEEDLIEEVARMVGYDKLPATPPLAPMAPQLAAEARRSPFAVRRALAGAGYQETINFSFVPERWELELAANPQPIRLLNPIASQMSVMRSTLFGSLLQVLRFNLDRKAARVRVFELGRVFLRADDIKNTDTTVAGIHQPLRVAGLAYGPGDILQWGRKEQAIDFFDVKGDVQALLAPLSADFEAASHPALHPGRCARVLLNGRAIGFVGELHPQWRQSWELPQAPVLFELELDAVLQREVARFRPVARHQAVERDLAVVVAERVTHADIMAAVQRAAPDTMRSAVLYDIYRPKAPRAGEHAAEPASATGLTPGEKSLALRLTLASDEATLTETRIDAAVQAVADQLARCTGARLRAG